MPPGTNSVTKCSLAGEWKAHLGTVRVRVRVRVGVRVGVGV